MSHKTLVVSMRRFASALLLLIATSSLADPLFESDEAIELRLAAPFAQIAEEKDKTQRYAGILTHGDRTFDIELEVRGNKRLSKCSNPPLRVNFGKSQIDDTLFDKQDGIKLVVKCEKSGRYDDYVRKEFLIYRAMNQLTDRSYRVRWANITYVDTDTADERTEGAFFIERKSRVAKRLGLKTTDVVSVDVAELDPAQASLVNLFQFVVANPDFSIIAAPPGDECCHNAKLLEGDGVYYPIIYDFDSTGVVNASYAAPSADLNIDEVTDRLYRGFCEHAAPLLEARQLMIASRDSLVGLFESDPILAKRAASRASTFMSRSLDILENDRRFDREINRRCR